MINIKFDNIYNSYYLLDTMDKKYTENRKMSSKKYDIEIEVSSNESKMRISSNSEKINIKIQQLEKELVILKKKREEIEGCLKNIDNDELYLNELKLLKIIN